MQRTMFFGKLLNYLCWTLNLGLFDNMNDRPNDPPTQYGACYPIIIHVP